ncbi:membrane protein insertase YidC, partial [Streptomyces sp. NPDC060131]
KRQQPKRQSKSQRQAKPAGETEPKTSLTKSDEPQDAEPAGKQDAKPAAGAKKPAQKSGGGGRSKAQSGQRKGPQRPKSPSKK